MLVSSKKNNNRKNSSFNDNVAIKKKQKNDEKICSFNNLTLIKDNQMKLMNQPKLCLNVIDFIKQKKKFFLENSFDVRGTREFLASKEVAMRVIKLNDEIIPQEEEKGRMSGNDNEKYEKKNKNIKLSGKRTISPRKSRKSHKKMNNNDFIIEQKEIMDKKSRKMKKSSKRTKSKISEIESKVDSSNLDSNSSNMSKDNNIIFDKISKNSPTKIYKFFIDNANEPEENFQKKLEKELKKVENLNQKKDKDKDKKVKIRRKSISRKDLPYKRPKRMNSVIVPKQRKTQSIFMFSEANKKLMVNDDLSLSSIGEQKINLTPDKDINKKTAKRVYGSMQINDRQIKEKLQKTSKDIKDEENKIYNNKSKVEIDSDKDSIISILSDLI